MSENPCALGERGNHQPVPIGQDLVVLERVDAGCARCEQPGARLFPAQVQLRFAHPQRLRPAAEGAGEMQDVGAGRVSAGLIVEIPPGLQVEDRLPESGLGRPEGLPEFIEAPHVEFSLDAFAVGILSGKEGPFRGAHVPQDIGEDLGCGLSQKRDAAHLGGFQAGHGRQRLIVEHFFEVGQQPLAVGRVAVQAESHVVPDAAEPHGRQCALNHFKCARFGGAVVAAQQKQKPVRRGELGGRLETAVPAVEADGDVVIGPVQQADAGRFGRCKLEGLAERARDSVR